MKDSRQAGYELLVGKRPKGGDPWSSEIRC